MNVTKWLACCMYAMLVACSPNIEHNTNQIVGGPQGPIPIPESPDAFVPDLRTDLPIEGQLSNYQPPPKLWGDPCVAPNDCAGGGKCLNGICAGATHCFDTFISGDETDIDCGGLSCKPCGEGRKCYVNTDCAGVNGVRYCVPLSNAWYRSYCNAMCGNGQLDQPYPVTDINYRYNETDLDCGGWSCLPCLDGRVCKIDADCRSQNCTNGLCRPTGGANSCSDGVRDGNETDVDCGGSCANPGFAAPRPPHIVQNTCDWHYRCASDSDCQRGGFNFFCYKGVCTLGADMCKDRVRNGTETDVDCGGDNCPDCLAGQRCTQITDCEALFDCVNNVCTRAQCYNGVKDGTETDIDCGGNCDFCSDGKKCLVNAGCSSNLCRAGTCQSTSCHNAMIDGTETDIDCGGVVCKWCFDGSTCAVNADCSSYSCVNHKCASTMCNDRAQDGTETDLDCGGTCRPCRAGQRCTAKSDCESFACVNQVCDAPTCIDKLKNGTETDIDCGGSCGPCLLGTACGIGADCQSGVCINNRCVCLLPKTVCGNFCSDLTTDTRNCGACGHACDPNITPYCAAGLCTDLIPAGLPCPQGVSAQCQTNYCSSQLICTDKRVGAPCGVNGDCLSQMCAMGRCL